MHNDTISLLQQFAHEGYRCSLLTNATLITSDIASEILKAKRVMEQVSLELFDKNVHESTRGKHNFDLTMKGIHNLQRCQCSAWLV